ncbi:MAG: hypothetical protein HY874_04660 [Chloroflexi bacterium]|nr:hypothetical protein [Chloroflexota bacterium]
MRHHQRSSERGQVLILFVALFSVILVLAAFAIDQGLWLNHRRIAQKDADAAARAGAAQYLMDISDPDWGAASDAALAMAKANGAFEDDLSAYTAPTFSPNDCEDGGNAFSCARASCPLAVGTPIADAPSIEIAVPRPAPGLFLRALGGDDAADIGAKSTACVGSVQTVGPSSVEGIPVEIISSDREPNSCFNSSGVARIGMQCVVIGAAQGNHPRGAFFVPNSTACEGSGGGSVDIGNGIENGIDYTCTINTGNSCTSTTCVNDFTGNMQGNDIDGVKDRLDRSAPAGLSLCADSADGPTAFRNAFTYADGTTIPSPKRPPGLNTPVNSTGGNADPVSTVYLPKACWSPRIALVVVSDNGVRVRGFAAIFITGCFEERSGQPGNALTSALNTCENQDQYGGHTEVRAVLLRIFLTDGAVGGIGPITTTSQLAIQTTR